MGWLVFLTLFSATNGLRCWTDGGNTNISYPCASSWVFQSYVDDTPVEQAFSSCIELSNKFKPAGLSVGPDGNVNGSQEQQFLFMPTHPNASANHWCSVNNYYSVSRPSSPWGFCYCENFQFPTRSPNTLSPTSPTNTPTTGEPTSSAPTSTPTMGPSTLRPSTLSPTITPTDTNIPTSTPSVYPTSNPTIAPTFENCVTFAGFEVDENCRFPFKFEGREYTSCIAFSEDEPYAMRDAAKENRLPLDYKTKYAWCSTASNYDSKEWKKRQWGVCPHSCYSVAPTSAPTIECRLDLTLNDDESDTDCGGPSCPGCSENKTCVEPSDCESNLFCSNSTCTLAKFIGLEQIVWVPKTYAPYYSSTEISGAINQVLSHVSVDNQWANFSTTVEASIVPEVETSWPSCVTDGGWVAQETECVFPFTYKGITYNQCADASVIKPYWGNDTYSPRKAPPFLYNVFWCSINTEYDDSGFRESWGFCDCGKKWPTIQPTSAPVQIAYSDIPGWCKGIELAVNELLNAISTEARWYVQSTREATHFESANTWENDTHVSMKVHITASISELFENDKILSIGELFQDSIVRNPDLVYRNETQVDVRCTPTQSPSAMPLTNTDTPFTASLTPSIQNTEVPSVQGASTAPTITGPVNDTLAPSIPTSSAPSTAGPTTKSFQPSTSPPSSLGPSSNTLVPSALISSAPSNTAPISSTWVPSSSTPTLTVNSTAAPTIHRQNQTEIAIFLKTTVSSDFVDHPFCDEALLLLSREYLTGADIRNCTRNICGCVEKLLELSFRFGPLCLHRLHEYNSKRLECASLKP